MKPFAIPDIPTRQLVGWTLAVTAVVVGFWLLWRFQEVLLLLVTALILGTALRPAVLRLEQWRIPKPLGILLILGLLGLLLGLLIWYSLPILAQQSAAIGHNLAQGYQALRHSLQQIPNILVRRLLLLLPTDLTALPTLSADIPVVTEVEAALPASDDIGGSTANRLILGLFQFVALGILIFYWTVDSERLKQALFLLIPLQNRETTRTLVQEIETKVGGYILGQGLLCLLIGILAFIAYMLIGLPNALLLAVFAGLFEAIPTIGPFLGAVPAILVALSISPVAALWVMAASVIIQQLENGLLVPRVMSRTIGMRPLVTLLALLAFGSLFGILGALIALPLAGVVQLLLDHYLLTGENTDEAEAGRDRLSVLRYETNELVQDVRSQIRHKEGVPSATADELEDEVEAIALDLQSYLAAQEGGTT